MIYSRLRDNKKGRNFLQAHYGPLLSSPRIPLKTSSFASSESESETKDENEM